MKNPFRVLTLPERLSILQKDKFDEYLQAKLTLAEATSRLRLAREKLRIVSQVADSPEYLLAGVRPTLPELDLGRRNPPFQNLRAKLYPLLHLLPNRKAHQQNGAFSRNV